MSEKTPNYQLIKPADEDFYNIADFNKNADIIDTNLKTQKDDIDNLAAKVPKTDNVPSNDTFLMGKVAGSVKSFVFKTVADIKILLGLKAAAYKDVGSEAGKVAPGDHGHTAADVGADPAGAAATAEANAKAASVPLTQKGVANGVASLDSDGNVDNKQLEGRTLLSPTLVGEGRTAVWEDISIPIAVLGTGWIDSGNGTYTHTVGQTAVLSFAFNFVKDVPYELDFSASGGTVDNNFDILRASSASAASGQRIAPNQYYNNDILFIANDKYGFLNILPKGNFNGTFKLTKVRQCISKNSAVATLDDKKAVVTQHEIFIGGGGLYSMGDINTANGVYALNNNTTGRSNTANGVYALYHNTTGGDNTANGVYALQSNTTGGDNTANGSNALQSNTTGGNNTANGYRALNNNTTGGDNTANGSNALQGNTTGDNNTANGYCALCYNTTGSNNTANGYCALQSNTTGGNNTANGYRALYNNTTGTQNTANGVYALNNNTTGGSNTANGYGALCYNTTGYNNTANGNNALYYNTTGGGNIANGYDAGRYLSDGTTIQLVAENSIFIGAESRGGAEDNQTNQIVIGCRAKGYGSNTAHIGNADIATISYGAGTGTAFTNRSDPRIKEDITPADLDICYKDVKNLPLHRFKYKNFVGNTGDKHLTGFLSNEFETLLPKAVHKTTQSFDKLDEKGETIYKTIMVDEKEWQIDDETGERVEVTKEVEKQVPEQVVVEDCASIDTSQLVPTLFGAVQKLMAKVEALEAQLASKQ